MSPAPLPPDEATRLATLESYQVLDSVEDARFQRVVQTAASHFRTPMCAISFVDADRQWFKAAAGFDLRETPRDQAFCAHTILNPADVMVVDDAAQDPRFSDNALVTGGPGIRFYAGASLRAENGQPLGALCIIDSKPRTLSTAGRRELMNMAANASTVLELHRKTVLLQQSATCDPLTGLANRRHFNEALAAAMDGALAGRPFGVLALDLDGFKQINQAIGSAGGDMVLQDVAQRLQGCIRGADLAARLDGDIFALIVAGPVEIGTANSVARRVVAALTPPHLANGQAIPITASIGIAMAPLHATSATSLMRAANEALYAAKRAGGNRIVAAAHMPGRRRSRPTAPGATTMEEDLARAVRTGALSLHWQPYFNMRTGRVTGHEALVRWLRPGHGPVPPSAFIPVAEASSLISALDACVLRMACTQAQDWDPALSISVNISPYSLARGSLVRLVQDTLAATGFPARRLVIELTERTLVDNPQAALERIQALNAMGVRLSLDDFGTGYSSLGYLRQFPFDCVKLDRSFVAGLGSDTRAEAVAFAILQLGRALDMQVCAEGVETDLQFRFLANARCDLVQGFLLGRPLPVPQMVDARAQANVPVT